MPNLAVPVSQQFQAEAKRLNIDPETLVCWLCEEFANNPPDSLAIPRTLIPGLSVALTNQAGLVAVV